MIYIIGIKCFLLYISVLYLLFNIQLNGIHAKPTSYDASQDVVEHGSDLRRFLKHDILIPTHGKDCMERVTFYCNYHMFASEKWLEYLKRPEYQSYLEDYKDESLCKAEICVKMLAHLLSDVWKSLEMIKIATDSQTLITFSVNIMTNDGSPVIVSQNTTRKKKGNQLLLKNSQSTGFTVSLSPSIIMNDGFNEPDEPPVPENIPTIYNAIHLMPNGTMQKEIVATGTENHENLYPIPDPELHSNKEHIKHPNRLLPSIPPTNCYYEIFIDLSRIMKSLSLEFYFILTDKMTVDEILETKTTQLTLLEFYLNTLMENHENLTYIHLNEEMKHFLYNYCKVMEFINQFNQRSSLYQDIQTTPVYNDTLLRANFFSSGQTRISSSTEIESVNNILVYKAVEYALDSTTKAPQPYFVKKFKEFTNEYENLRKSSASTPTEKSSTEEDKDNLEETNQFEDNDHLENIGHFDYTTNPTFTTTDSIISTVKSNAFQPVHNVDIDFDTAVKPTTVKKIPYPISVITEIIPVTTERTEFQEVGNNSDDEYESPLEAPPQSTVHSILVELLSNGKIEILKKDDDLLEHNTELFAIPKPDEKLLDTDLNDINNILPKFDQNNANYPRYIETRSLMEKFINDPEFIGPSEKFPTKIKYLNFLIMRFMSSSKEISSDLNEFLLKYHKALDLVEKNQLDAEKRFEEKCKNEEELNNQMPDVLYVELLGNNNKNIYYFISNDNIDVMPVPNPLSPITVDLVANITKLLPNVKPSEKNYNIIARAKEYLQLNQDKIINSSNYDDFLQKFKSKTLFLDYILTSIIESQASNNIDSELLTFFTNYLDVIKFVNNNFLKNNVNYDYYIKLMNLLKEYKEFNQEYFDVLIKFFQKSKYLNEIHLNEHHDHNEININVLNSVLHKLNENTSLDLNVRNAINYYLNVINKNIHNTGVTKRPKTYQHHYESIKRSINLTDCIESVLNINNIDEKLQENLKLLYTYLLIDLNSNELNNFHLSRQYKKGEFLVMLFQHLLNSATVDENIKKLLNQFLPLIEMTGPGDSNLEYQ